ncbi:MAG: hypothetical protein Q8Q09_18325 [Deltaproteobacteria bacterium]|nr:hypothetical protein [Deltaproteobacteria bacterium]
MASLRLIRENAWVRVYETESGDYTDSKLRTHECVLDGPAWFALWHEGDEDTRMDLEAAFVFWDDQDAVEQALALVGAVDPAAQRALGSRWIAPDDPVPVRHTQFLAAYRIAQIRRDLDLPQLHVELLDAAWFRVVRTMLGVELESKIDRDFIVLEREVRDEEARCEDPFLRSFYALWWSTHRRTLVDPSGE